MLSPDYLDSCGDWAASLYEPLQASIIADMARRLINVGYVSDATLHQLNCIQESGMLFDDIVSAVSAHTNRTSSDLLDLFYEAGAETLQFDDSVYLHAGLTPSPIAQSASMLNTLLAGFEKTNGALANLTMTTATATQAQFIAASDLAYLQVSSGSMSYTQAIRGALGSLARQGVTTVRYDKGGREIHHKIDVATRRAVLTGVNQTAAQLQSMRLDEMGWDLVEVTDHIGARPSHADWQGQIYSWNGRNGEYPDFVDSTGYGTGEGLCGWNCRHNFFPYLDGYSRPAFTGEELRQMEEKTIRYEDEDISIYDATQIERGMERRVREFKRELVALNSGALASSDDALRQQLLDGFALTSVKLKAQEQEIRNFANLSGVGRQREREQVVGFGRSPAQKAVWQDKKARGIAQKIH